MRFLLISSLLCTGLSATPQANDDPDAIEQYAIALARSRDFSRLSKMLHDPQFLAGLSDGAPGKTHRLGHILTALKQNAAEDTAALCRGLASDPQFLADPDRMSFLVDVLAAVRPMTKQTADLFRRTALDGYFASNARLLAMNGSPTALALFASLMLAKDEPIEDRVECLRVAIFPRRTLLPILTAAENILTKTAELRLAEGVVESVFDYHPEWFRPSTAPRAPQPWQRASPGSLRAALRIGEIALNLPSLRPALRRVVQRETVVVRQALAARVP